MSATRTHTVPDAPSKIDAASLGWFRFGALDGRVVLTNEFGEWHVLDRDAFRKLVEGGIDAQHGDYDTLAAKGFVRAGLDPDHVAQALRRRKRFVGIGPSVHLLPLSEGDRRLSVETAKDILDFAMLSTSTTLDLRLVPGPLPLDLEQLGFLTQYGTEKNRYEGKALTWRLEIDPAHLDDAAAAWLVDKRFKVRAPWTGTLSEATVAGIGRLHAAAAARRRDGWTVEVDATVGRSQLAALAALPTTLRAHGLARFRVRPVLHGDDAVSPRDFAEAYRALLDDLLTNGAAPVEELGAGMVTRITRTDASSDASVRSPTGAGMGIVTYDLEGTIYPGEHARLTPDPEMFALGRAGITAYKEATRHPTLRALALASLLECLPGFSDHWATPYLGVDPLLAFATTGDLFTRAPTSPEVAVQVAVIEAVLGVLAGDDTARAEALGKWAES